MEVPRAAVIVDSGAVRRSDFLAAPVAAYCIGDAARTMAGRRPRMGGAAAPAEGCGDRNAGSAGNRRADRAKRNWNFQTCSVVTGRRRGPSWRQRTGRDSVARALSHSAARQSDSCPAHAGRSDLLVLSNLVVDRTP